MPLVKEGKWVVVGATVSPTGSAPSSCMGNVTLCPQSLSLTAAGHDHLRQRFSLPPAARTTTNTSSHSCSRLGYT